MASILQRSEQKITALSHTEDLELCSKRAKMLDWGSSMLKK